MVDHIENLIIHSYNLSVFPRIVLSIAAKRFAVGGRISQVAIFGNCCRVRLMMNDAERCVSTPFQGDDRGGLCES